MILETKVIAKHTWKVYNYKMATLRGSSVGAGAVGSCVASLSTASQWRSEESGCPSDNYQEA